MANPLVAIYLEGLARNADDPELAELTANLNLAAQEVDEDNAARVAAKTAHIQAKADFDMAYATALIDGTESNAQRRDGAALLACAAEHAELTGNTITLVEAEATYNSSVLQWKVLRHIVVAKYGGEVPWGQM